MLRAAWRFAALFAVLTAFSWAVRLDSNNAQAQTTHARISSMAALSSSPVPSPLSPTSLSAERPAPVIVASGAPYANVRGLATDVAGGLYVSLSSTPPGKECVTSETRAASAVNPAASGATVPAARLLLTIFSNCKLAPTEDPYGIAVAPENKIYLVNRSQNAIRLLDMLSGKVSALPAGAVKNTEMGRASSNADPFEPAGLASDAQGDLYVADRGNNRVLRLAPGAAQFAFVAHVLDADAVAADAARGKVYVASPAANRVFVIDLNTSDIEAFAGSGAFAASADASGANSGIEFDGHPEKVQIGAPEGVAVDAQGNVFISDTGANAILRVDAKTGVLSRVAAAETLSSPGALAIDRSGDVFVADRGNERILEFPELAAQAATGNIVLSPATFDFGDQLTGGTTPAEVFTLTNNSTSALALTNASFAMAGANTQDFAQTNNCVPSLAAGASCQINVTFTPSQSGPRSATLEVTDSDPSSPQTASLSGTGDTFTLTVQNTTDTTQNVAAGGTATYNISVTPDSTFGGAVTLACPRSFVSPLGLSLGQANITCSINPQSPTITPGQPQSFAVTLATGGPNATRVLPWAWRNGPGGRLRFLLLALLAVLLAFLGWRTRHAAVIASATPRKVVTAGSAHRLRYAAIGFALLACAAAGGCKYSSRVNPNQTPTSIYTLMITGTAQNASRSITLTLNVD